MDFSSYLFFLAYILYRQDRREAIGLYSGKRWNWAVRLGEWLAKVGDQEGALAGRQYFREVPGH